MTVSNDIDMITALESYTKLAGTREQMIAANMANVDTPGYRTHDIDFEKELRRAINASTSEASFGGQTAELTPAVQEVQGLMERPDGNNVDLDREGLMLAQTQIQHQLGIQLIKHHFHGLMSAINGGGGNS